MAGAAVWGRRVKAWRASGVSAREFADGEDFAESTLRYWAWRIEKRDARSDTEAMRIVRVVREDARSSTPAPVAPTVSIEIGSARVSVGAGFDRSTLRDVLVVLRSLETERTS